jgi:hypothetical protein
MYPSEVPKKKCGTCKWFNKFERSEATGVCQYQIPNMPLSVIRSTGEPCEDQLHKGWFEPSDLKSYVYESDTNCPTWEEKS